VQRFPELQVGALLQLGHADLKGAELVDVDRFQRIQVLGQQVLQVINPTEGGGH
jgi:hypothetical protein